MNIWLLKKRKFLQLKGRNNVKHLIGANTKIIDQIRETCVPFFKVNSGLNLFSFKTFILFSPNIFINSFNMAASPNFAALIILGK